MGTNRPLGAGRYADALIPFLDSETDLAPANARFRAVPFVVAPQRNQPVWVDVQVPRNAVAGQYSATVIVEYPTKGRPPGRSRCTSGTSRSRPRLR